MFAHLAADAVKARRARWRGVGKRHRASGLDPEAVLEIAVGVMRGEERLAAHGRHEGLHPRRQRVEFGRPGRRIGPVGIGIGRVELGQAGSHFGEHGLAVGGVEPDMRVHVAMMLVAVLVLVRVLVLVVVVFLVRVLVLMAVLALVVVVLLVRMLVLVVVFPVGMLFLAAVVVVMVAVPLLAELQQRHPRRLHQLDRHGVRGEALHRIVQPGGQPLAHPEHDIGRLQPGRLGGPHGIAVRRRARRQDRRGLAHALHDARRQRVDRRNVRHDLGRRRGRQGGERSERGDQRESKEAAFHAGILYSRG